MPVEKGDPLAEVQVLMIGTGEYTTGYVGDAESTSDKGAGVVALTMFDLRRRGLVGRLLLAGRNGTRFPGIRRHLQMRIGSVYRGLDVSVDCFPSDDQENDPDAYLAALDQVRPGDIVTIFTPDDLHFQLAMEGVRRGCHVLIAKPLVKTLDEHRQLAACARQRGVLVAMEVHKRWDPIYLDARDRVRQLGDFSFFHSYMSQPKLQLETFRAWAGKSSDVSYYLNAHHIDFHYWCIGALARPETVYATAASGYANSRGIETEDTISLHVTWRNLESGNPGIATYTASWIAPPSDVHSQQRFSYMGHGGEVLVDQAHRGYALATDQRGYYSANPLFMKYEPDENGCFGGQGGYGYRSIEDFVVATRSWKDLDESLATGSQLATVDTTMWVTAILEAGRRSLDSGGRIVQIDTDTDGTPIAYRIE